MHELLNFGLFAFTSFLALLNPVGVAPVFQAMTSDLSPKLQRRTAFKATLTAFITLTIFAFAGQVLFSFFGISVNGFRIAGGVIFFIMGFDMLNARISKIKYNADDAEEELEDVAVTPLGIPMLAGPGSITNAIVLMQDAKTIEMKMILPVSIFAVLAITFASLVGGSWIMKFLGKTGNKIMLKLMGLIMMVIAVEFFFAGLKPILQDIIFNK
jgi:multiple antibiotic resistance protein